MSVTQLLALHSYRANYNTNRRIAQMEKQIYEGQDVMVKVKMTEEMALHIVERFKLGKGKYRELKILLRPFVILPDYSLLSSLRRSFCPVIHPYHDDDNEIIGVFAKICDSLKSHCLRMIQSGDLQLENTESSLCMNVTVGIDGRGDEKEYQQRSQVTKDTTHCLSVLYFLSSISELPTSEANCVECHRDPHHPVCNLRHTQDSPDLFSEDEESPCIPLVGSTGDSQDTMISKINCPLNFQEKKQEIWVEATPGSERAARPLVTALQKENRTNIENLVNNYLEKELIPLTHFETKPKDKNLRAPVVIVALQSGKLVPISADVNFGAMDNKLTKTLTGRTGAFCTACSASSTDMHKPEAISIGFYMNVGTGDLNMKFKELAGKFGIGEEDLKDWTVPSKKGDYSERLGLKRAPMTKEFEITKVLSVLHTKLRSVPFIEDLICRDLSGCRQWGDGKLPQVEKERYMELKEEWKSKLGPILGFKNKKAPNQITGHLCDMFFHEEQRPALITLIGDLGIWDEEGKRELTQTELNNFKTLIEGASVIGRVASCNQKVKVLELRKFCIDFHMFVSLTWPWILWGETFHRLVDHLWEFLLLNNNKGLGNVSEQSLESSHKVSNLF